ncbi:MAG: sulfate respiration complex protein HmcD [Thermodesulfobacteriota bacterium]
MESAIHTLHEFMLRTESITYILIVAGLIGITLFWRFLTERDE